MSDDDVTEPDIPSGLGEQDETTKPGVGTGEAFLAITSSADRAIAAIKTLVAECPQFGASGRLRHLEVLAHAWGELGMLCHDTRRVIIQLKHEEET